MRARMVGKDGVPAIYFFSTCTDSIRTIPLQQHDAVRTEDMDTDGEDHAADEVRYACMSRPYTRAADMPLRPVTAQPTIDELIRMQARRGDKVERV